MTELIAGKRITLQKIVHGKIRVGKNARQIYTPQYHVTAYLQNNQFVFESKQDNEVNPVV
ncbi:hypothetical protein D3C87_2087040 [compost metagenome]